MRWQDPVAVAAAGGYRGPWRMNDSVYDYVDDPTVAIDNRGAVALAWADQARKDIFLQVYGPDGEPLSAQPVDVSRSAGTLSWLPRLVMAPGEPGGDAAAVFVLWQEIIFSGGSHGGEILFARSTDGGKTFTAPTNLSKTTAGAGKGRITAERWDNGSLDLAMGRRGHLYAAWTEYEGALRFSRSTDGGAGFTEPVRIAGGGADAARGPSLAVEVREDKGDDVVYLAWSSRTDRESRIVFARSDDGGRSFAAPRLVAASAGHVDAPKIALDRTGTLHLVYAESPAGPFRRYHIRYARSGDGGGSFEAPRLIAGADAEPFPSVGFPGLSVAGDDTVLVLAEPYPRRIGRTRGLALTVSTDGGDTFSPPVLVPGTANPTYGANSGRQGLLMRKLAVNDGGAIAIVHSTFDPGRTSHIWLIRGETAGTENSAEP